MYHHFANFLIVCHDMFAKGKDLGFFWQHLEINLIFMDAELFLVIRNQ